MLHIYGADFGVRLDKREEKGRWRPIHLNYIPWSELLGILRIKRNNDAFVPTRQYDYPQHLGERTRYIPQGL
jgi:hypothetical protein